MTVELSKEEIELLIGCLQAEGEGGWALYDHKIKWTLANKLEEVIKDQRCG